MNQLSIEKRARLFHCLVECMSLRAASRVNDLAFNTVLKFNVDIGRACEAYQEETFRDLNISHIEADEIWSFVGTKEKDNVTPERAKDWSHEVYTWTSVDPISRLMPCWHVGGRQQSDAYFFIQKLKYTIKDSGKNLQLVTDGNITYLPAVEELFGKDIDYVQYYKAFHGQGNGKLPDYVRYSMPRLKATKRKVMIGNPDMSLSTNHIERSNLTLRCGLKRFARLTNAFSKKMENHRLAVAMHMMYYNFCSIHGKLRVTPAMQAGISDHIWTVEEVVRLMDRYGVEKSKAA